MQRAQPVQGSWGRSRPGVLEEQRGGLYGWSRVGEGERGRTGRTGRGRGRCVGPRGARRGLGLLLPRGRSPGEWEGGSGTPAPRPHRCPRVAAVVKTDCGARGPEHEGRGGGLAQWGLDPGGEKGPFERIWEATPQVGTSGHDLWGQVQDEALLSPGRCGPAQVPPPCPRSCPWTCRSHTWIFDTGCSGLGAGSPKPRLSPAASLSGASVFPPGSSSTSLPRAARLLLGALAWGPSRDRLAGWEEEQGSSSKGRGGLAGAQKEEMGQRGQREVEGGECGQRGDEQVPSCITPHPGLPGPTHPRATRAGRGDTGSSLGPLDLEL